MSKNQTSKPLHQDYSLMFANIGNASIDAVLYTNRSIHKSFLYWNMFKSPKPRKRK